MSESELLVHATAEILSAGSVAAFYDYNKSHCVSVINQVKISLIYSIRRGSYRSAHVSLNLLNKFEEKRSNARLAEHFISFLLRV